MLLMRGMLLGRRAAGPGRLRGVGLRPRQRLCQRRIRMMGTSPCRTQGTATRRMRHASKTGALLTSKRRPLGDGESRWFLGGGRRERNRESARASRKKRKQHLQGLEGRVTSLAVQIDEERLKRAEIAVASMDLWRSEFLAAARRVAAQSGIPADLRAAALASVPSLARERFSVVSAEKRALMDLALESALEVVAPVHLRPLVFMADQPESFFTSSEARQRAATTAPIDSPAFRGTSAPAALGGSDSPGEGGAPDLWGILCDEVWLQDSTATALRNHLRSSHRADATAVADAIRSSHELRTALADASRAVGSLSAQVSSILTPEQWMRFEEFVAANPDRVKACFSAKRDG